MSINIRQDIQIFHNYVNSLDSQPTGLLRGNDGVLRQVTINDESAKTKSISDIVKEILDNRNIATLSRVYSIH